MRADEGCPLEITICEVYTLNRNLNQPRRAVEIVRKKIENRPHNAKTAPY